MAGIEKKLMDKWIVKSSENLIDNNWVKVRRDDVELPNGEEIKDFYVVSLNEAVRLTEIHTVQSQDLSVLGHILASYNVFAHSA